MEKFITLSEEFLQLLASEFILGKPTFKKGIRVSVISKQTSVVYKLNPSEKHIELLLFWNNLKNPEEYQKLLS